MEIYLVCELSMMALPEGEEKWKELISHFVEDPAVCAQSLRRHHFDNMI